jgi:N utilization substance protein B
MINRRLIRIKAFKVLFAAEVSQTTNMSKVESELLQSLEKTRDLTLFLLNICVPLTRLAKERTEAARHKFRPTESEANPNLKFVENEFAQFLANNDEFNKLCNKRGLSWNDYDIFVKKLYSSVISSDYYAEYMASPVDSFAEDGKLFKRIFLEEFENNEMLESILEDSSIYWADELNYAINNVVRIIERTYSKKRLVIPSLFSQDDDRDFAMKLLRESIFGWEKYHKEMTESVPNWDADRLVATDATLVVMGIAEAVAFPQIPIKTTINEYIDIAKGFGTPNSSNFVNGLLGKVIFAKVDKGEIVKSGRGLCEGNSNTNN